MDRRGRLRHPVYLGERTDKAAGGRRASLTPRHRIRVDPTWTESIRLTVPATSAAVRITRGGAAGLATRAGFTYREVEQMRLAVGEAAALLAPEPEGDGTLRS